MTDKRICILGLGYVGLTLAVILAEAGLKVIGIEKNKEVAEALKQGKLHFYEKGLAGALRFALDNSFEICSTMNAVPSADVYIISVGTPVGEDRKPKLDDLINVSQDVGKVLKKGDLVCLRSTVAPTTTREIVMPILEKMSGLRAGYDFFLSFAPERAAEGKALEELKNLSQIIGGLNGTSASLTADIFNKIASKIIIVNSL
ncbi:nucleotide sugar dehydrogenase, partial [Patescibacteria group bacterium]|nr:nucleotide sugar dehydrogenase [Patescibacteria group bacterium]